MADVFDSYAELKVERKPNGILLITLNRPEKLNAMTYTMHAELARIWHDVDHDKNTRVAVVTGAGRAFCSGNDLKNPDPDFDGVQDIMRDAIRIVRGMVDCEKPIISAINGVAVGAGLAVALLADLSIAAEDAKLIDGHAKVGVVAGDHACLLWPMLCGLTRAKYYLWGLETLTGKRAEEIGIVTKALPVDQVLPEAMRIAELLAQIVAALDPRNEARHQWLAASVVPDLRTFRGSGDDRFLRSRRTRGARSIPGEAAREISFGELIEYARGSSPQFDVFDARERSHLCCLRPVRLCFLSGWLRVPKRSRSGTSISAFIPDIAGKNISILSKRSASG